VRAKRRHNREKKIKKFVNRIQYHGWIYHHSELPWNSTPPDYLSRPYGRGSWNHELNFFGMAGVPWLDGKQTQHPSYWMDNSNNGNCTWYDSELEKEKKHVKRQVRIDLHHAARDTDPLDNEDNHRLDVR